MKPKYSVFMAIVYVLLICSTVFCISEVFPCEEIVEACEEAIIAQSLTINQCRNVAKDQDKLIETVKEQTVATEKSLSNQKIATKTGFGLSGLLLLLLIL